MKEQTLKEDPNVKMPAAVKAAAARSQEIYEAMKGQSQEEGTDDDEVTQEGNDGQPALTAEPEVTSEDNDQPAKPVDKAEPDHGDDGETWEHKYKSLHGRHKHAMEKLREQGNQIQQMQNLLATMQQPVSERTMSADVPELDPELQLTEDELNDYGEDFLKVVGKKARAELAPIINGYKAMIEDLKGQLNGVKGVMQSTSQEKMLSQLDQKVPKWREMNTNEEFLDWLGLPDPYSGAIRHDMLKAAYAQGDATRVAAFFNGFLAEEAAVAPAGDDGPDLGRQQVPKVPLETLAAPGRAKTAASAQAPAEKPIITRAEIAAFYADVASGKYRGRDEAKAQVEARIFAAQREGRIR